MLNDRFHPGGTVHLDGKPVTILRCNYLVRGVLLPPGDRLVTFHFESPKKFLFWWHFAQTAGSAFCCSVESWACSCGRMVRDTGFEPVTPTVSR